MKKLLLTLLLISFSFAQWQGYNSFNTWINKNMKLVYRSNFSLGTDNWGHYNTAIQGNIDNVYGKSNVLKIHADTTNGQHNIRKENVFVLGKEYKIYGYVFINNNSNLKGIKISDGYAEDGVLDINIIGEWVHFSLTINADNNTKLYMFGMDSTGSLYFQGSSDSSDDLFYIYDIRIYEK